MCIDVCVYMDTYTQIKNKFKNYKALQHDKTKTMIRDRKVLMERSAIDNCDLSKLSYLKYVIDHQRKADLSMF